MILDSPREVGVSGGGEECLDLPGAAATAVTCTQIGDWEMN